MRAHFRVRVFERACLCVCVRVSEREREREREGEQRSNTRGARAVVQRRQVRRGKPRIGTPDLRAKCDAAHKDMDICTVFIAYTHLIACCRAVLRSADMRPLSEGVH